MRGFASYLLAGFVVVLALDFIAPPAGLGMSLGAWSVTAPQAQQSVDRANKGDRLPVSVTSVSKSKTPQKAPALLAGCEPVFSPLSMSARANFAGRCVA